MEALESGDPQWIGEYRLLRRLGAGGMGRVYLGRTVGGRTVAVKTVHAQYAADPEFRVRFRQEVAAARQVGVRWTAPVLDADTEGEQPWVATGYVAGPSLAAALRDFGPLPASAVRSLGIGLAEALAVLHGRGLVHRDVKPSNVLLALDGPRLIDFGIARALDATALTQSGFVVGSPGYLSPEQAAGRRADPAADVFSLGAVLACAATGRAPFGAAQSTPVLLYRVVHEQPDLDGLDGLDRQLCDTIAACLAKDPAERPTPQRLRELLTAGEPAAATRLDEHDWLPPVIAGSLARLAVELLDLDAEAAARPGTVPPSPSLSYVPTVTAAPAQGYGPASQSRTPPAAATAAAGRPGPARSTVVLAVALAAVVAGTAVYLGTRPDGSSNGAPRTSPTVAGLSSTLGPAPSAPVTAAADSVPAAFLGTWQGRLGSPQLIGTADFSITISQGRKGEAVAAIRNNTGPGTAYCDATADLISVATDRLVLKTRPMSILSGCVANPHDQVYTRNIDGSLHLAVDTFSGDLAKS
ncbi:hypothetical protein CFP65_7642 [Kitasatospora sp. MMS16-BH015]|uniref:serine/threonine-protein kinase n=1 Tax=Kitasatospora sp. MMS16-BH015 TaxID=2018025 RepID=UPI000CA183A2|nr:serine/threonine-protein kinase [Kitasatospora sp. MMS16-BH015]AUG82212.1 hypothetical protein CFP65_7642 [Kitasatospora sp. MMS16-BH015]